MVGKAGDLEMWKELLGLHNLHAQTVLLGKVEPPFTFRHGELQATH